MGKSHAVGWASDAPRPAQLKEFFAQCEEPKPRITGKRLQNFLRGKEGGDGCQHSFMPSPLFADEEYESSLTYPGAYKAKSVIEQLLILDRHFPELDADLAVAQSKRLPNLPPGAEGWFVAPKRVSTRSFHDNMHRIKELLQKTRDAITIRLDVESFSPDPRSSAALSLISDAQLGDYIIFPAQFGLRHRGRSARRVRELIGNSCEFGLEFFEVGCMLLTHPKRIDNYSNQMQLAVSCPGDFNRLEFGWVDFVPHIALSNSGMRISYATSADASSVASATGFVVSF